LNGENRLLELEKKYVELVENLDKKIQFEKQLNRIKEEKIIDRFSKSVVIPKYGFPVDVVDLTILDNEEKLKDLYDKLKYYGANVVAFTEPDIDDQWTSICYYGTPEMRKITEKLDLALNN
jgi:chaperonin GroEL (HSP60 family)